MRIKRFEDIEVSLSSNIQSSIPAYPGWDVAANQFVFSNQHQILVPEMRRDNLNDLHEAAADEANSEDHDGGEKNNACNISDAITLYSNNLLRKN